MRLGVEQRLEGELVGGEHFLDDLAVTTRQVENPQLAADVRDILDDLVRLLLAQGEVVARGVKLAYHIDERVHRKRVVLARHAEMWHATLVGLVLAFEQLGLLDDLAGIAQKRRALLGDRHALVCALEDMHAHLAFQLADSRRDGGLRHKKPACRLGDATALGDLRCIYKLLEFHRTWPFGGEVSIGKNMTDVLGRMR